MDIQNIPDGIYTNISIEDYHANRTHLSATQIKMADRSLSELKWFLDGKSPVETKKHFDFGNAFELALLDKEGFANNVGIFPDSKFVEAAMADNPKLVSPRQSKPYKTLKAEFEQSCGDMYVIDDKGETNSYEAIECMLESCYKDSVIKRLIDGVDYQTSIFWTDPETGVKLKTRPDICKVKKNIIVNLKTSLDGSPQGFSRDLGKYNYPLQAAIEIEGCIQSGLMETVDFYYWLVVEKVPPYNATIYNFDMEDRTWLSMKLGMVLHKIKQAQEQGIYPGYSERSEDSYGILKAEIPLWYKN